MCCIIFGLFMNGVVKDIKARIGNTGVMMSADDTKWKLNSVVYS